MKSKIAKSMKRHINSLKKPIVEQLIEAMEKRHISKSELARRLKTSRPAIDKLLDPDFMGTSLGTLEKACKALKCKIRMEV